MIQKEFYTTKPNTTMTNTHIFKDSVANGGCLTATNFWGVICTPME